MKSNPEHRTSGRRKAGKGALAVGGIKKKKKQKGMRKITGKKAKDKAIISNGAG